MEWGPIILTFRLASITTVLLFLVALPLSYWIAFSRSRWKPVLETLISMPLVLPPTVIGFYLLVAFSPENALGTFLHDYMGLQLVFSFEGLVIASMIYSLPFMVQPLQAGLANLPPNLKEASYVMGKSRMATAFYVLFPTIKTSILTGLVLTFAHTIGEFGVVLMIGGNIPNETRVASIAIYDEVESLNYANANAYSLFLFILTFSILLTVYVINSGQFKRIWK
ncbi:MAG: molybdate ABC transporter permease subunit [Cyclobacteriaceae bacterium]|nr:molybdate ABC transporter permease subunit [Cyclobacteriaceae bacterium]